MAAALDRPFIPHRTPKSALQAISTSEFRLSRPFVPGAERATVATFQLEPARQPVDDSSLALPPIQNFLDLSEAKAEAEELPPLEHFLDPLPTIGEFAPEAGAALDEFGGPAGYLSENATAPTAVEAEWVEDDWQHYDWRAAAALGDGAESAASQEWATTDWDSRLPRSNEDKPSSAQAIANALDQIARQIREGAMPVSPAGGATDPAAIAATLAALLGVKR